MRRYQGPDMPLLAHMLHPREPAFEQAQQQDVYQAPPSPVVAPHPSPDLMPSPPRQSSPPHIPFGLAPTSRVVSTDPIPDIPSLSGPSEPKIYGPDMPLLAHMLNLGEPAFVQAQQHDVSHPPPSPVVALHPSLDPMPSPPRQSLPPPIPLGPAPTSGVVSTDPISDIPSSSEPVLETITSPFRDDDTDGGSLYESLHRPHPATPTLNPTVGVAEEPLTLTSLLALFPTCLQRIATLEAELKATKILHRDAVNEEEARQSQELDALLETYPYRVWTCTKQRATGIGLGLWMDLRTLITSREEGDASIIWDDQD
nr:hypothetical protein [Tanacetum cinerariifolium]